MAECAEGVVWLEAVWVLSRHPVVISPEELAKKIVLPLLVVVWLSFVLLVVDYLPGI